MDKFVEVVSESIDILHYGMPRRSGRYPWGSGDKPFQHSGDFLSRYSQMKDSGMSDSDIAKYMNIHPSDLKIFITQAKHIRRAEERDRAITLKNKGVSIREIGRIMGKNESSIRSLLNEDIANNKDAARRTADRLEKELKEKGMLDVGAGAEVELGVSREKLQEALYILNNEKGYNIYGMGISTGKRRQSNTQILTLPDVTYKDVYDNQGDIKNVGEYYSPDNGKTFNKLSKPASLDSSRVYIRYAEDGGLDKDGVIELRKNVPDLNMGNSHYAQVRILVDDDRYMKGMAMYADDIPEGYDIVYNTNKHSGTAARDVFKKTKTDVFDETNPFGALIKANGQTYYEDPKTGEKKLSPINKLKEEGDWNEMSKTLSSQFLSKQSKELIQKQLKQTYDNAVAEYEDILNIQNPTLRKKFLKDFADDCDSSLVHLKAAALPRQRTQVILPVDIPDTEIYAPNYKSGEEVVLVRFPHGSIAEIPRLRVNNENKKAKSILGQASDAVGINPKVAGILSGADFDGDTVLVIPVNDRVKVNNKKPLAGLIGYEPKEIYSLNDKIKEFESKGVTYKDEDAYIKAFKKQYGISLLNSKNVQREMGVVSNLITDMTLKGAPEEELTRAIRHSMTVIDANKHKLDYKQSEIDNDIDSLRRRWQSKGIDENGKEVYGGASTLLSKKNQTIRIPERKGSGVIDKETGEVTYRESGRKYYDKSGKLVPAMTEVKLYSTIKDFKTVSTGTPQEELYANYANQMLALANTARKEYVNTKGITKSSSAAKTYDSDVKSLKAKLNVAKMNAPLERRANAMANSELAAKKQSNPEMTKKEEGKIRQIALTKARQVVGASAQKINISDSEWNAIKNGAVSENMFNQILRYADADQLRQRALPKDYSISGSKQRLIKQLYSQGYTASDIADQLNISENTVYMYK